MTKEAMVYDGITWYRDVDSDNNLFRYWHKSNGDLLHRYIYEKHYGPIPEGYAIHHIDFDMYNNDPTNLMCLTPQQHMAIHMKCNAENEAFIAKRKEHLDKIRPMSKEWHASEEGHKWHVEHGKKVASEVEERAYICEQCGKEFFTKPFGTNKFCCNACKSAYRRKMRLDDEERVCAFCGNTFTINKYSKTQCCSRRCSQRMRRQSE